MGEILEIFSLDKFEDVFGIMTPVLEKVSAVYVISEITQHLLVSPRLAVLIVWLKLFIDRLRGFSCNG